MDFDDPELAKDMIKILGQELKLLRAQLSDAGQSLARSDRSNSTFSHIDCTHTAEAENTHLKAQIKQLNTELVQSRSGVTGDRKKVSRPEKVLEKTKNQLAELSEEKDRVEAEKDAKISQLKDKCKSNREKYKAQKAANTSLQQEKYDIEAKLEELNRECDLQNDRTPSGGFKFETYLATAHSRPYPSGIQPYTGQFTLFFSKDTKQLLSEAAPETLHYNDQELVWSEDNISRAVAILPFRRYNPKARNNTGTWERGVKPMVGKICNLFFCSEEAWWYMGTFKCVQANPLEPEQFSAVPSHVKQHIYQRTVLFPDLVPNFLINMVEEMYVKGALRAECFSFEFQDFDEAFNNRLLGNEETPEHSISVPLKCGADNGTALKTYSKKRKAP